MNNLFDKLAVFILNIVKICAMGRDISKRDEILLQSIKFGIVGVSNTILSYVLYAISLYLLQAAQLLTNCDYIIAQAVSFIISVYWSFYWNDRLVFIVQDGESRNYLHSLIKTYISYSFSGIFLSAILLYLWIDVLGISAYIAPIINLVVTVPLNFIINKFWAFKTK